MSGPQPPGSITYTSLPPSRNPWPLRLLRATRVVTLGGVWYYNSLRIYAFQHEWIGAIVFGAMLTAAALGGFIGLVILLLWVWFGDVNR